MYDSPLALFLTEIPCYYTRKFSRKTQHKILQQSRLSRQRPASAGWCGTPPRSMSLVAAVAGCEEDEALARPAAVRARFFGAIARSSQRRVITREQ